MIFKKFIFFPAALLFVQTVLAQGGATITATIDKYRILIGEPVQLTIEARLSPGAVIKFISIDSIEHFELLGKPVIDTINQSGRVTIKGVYRITSFDSGHWVIPSFVLTPSVQTDTIPVDVVFSDFDPNKDYHDVKDILPVKPVEKNEWWYMAAGGLILLVLIIYLLLKKRKPTLSIKPEVPVNAYDEATRQLIQLEKDRPDVKEYYSRLTDIFRLYVYRKKNILSLQKTTDDLVIQLDNLNMGKESFDKLSQALRLIDFVKFAKYIPSEQDKRSAYETIKNSIDTIERMTDAV
jgi:LPXTG-motif cell wall-anchored protein